MVSCHKHSNMTVPHALRPNGIPCHTPTLMITISVDLCNPITQNFYDDVIHSLQSHQLTCPCCGHCACLSIHGYYDRSLRQDGSSCVLHICRAACSQCGHTHALLPSSIVPYSQVPLADQADAIAGQPQTVMERNPLVDESSIRSILRRFRLHWQQKLLSQGITLQPLGTLIIKSFSHFNRQFMQIKTTPNILFLRPT